MYNEKIMKLALEISELSKDPTVQVGCVITNQSDEILSVGYNKLKEDIPQEDLDYIYSNKEVKKYSFIHAEMVAVSRLKPTDEELNIYITYPSCINCATGFLLNNNYTFKNLYYINRGSESFFERYKIKEAFDLMDYKKVMYSPINKEICERKLEK